MTYYDSERSKRKIWKTIKTDEEKKLELAKKLGFPNCKGTFPHCPENPTKEHQTCSQCPMLEEDDWC